MGKFKFALEFSVLEEKIQNISILEDIAFLITSNSIIKEEYLNEKNEYILKINIRFSKEELNFFLTEVIKEAQLYILKIPHTLPEKSDLKIKIIYYFDSLKMVDLIFDVYDIDKYDENYTIYLLTRLTIKVIQDCLNS